MKPEELETENDAEQATVKAPPIMLGLDGEMSSADLSTGGRLIQVGFALLIDDKPEIFTSLIGYDVDSWDDVTWNQRSSQVHKITKGDLAFAPLASVVDKAAHAWLLARGAVLDQRQLVSIGFNVAAFDHPFFRATLPLTMSLISRRAVDLNALCFTLGGWDPNISNTARKWTGWKSSLKDYADAQLKSLGTPGQPHDAGWDAAQAILGWNWVKEQVFTSHSPGRYNPSPGQDRVLASVLGTSVLSRLEPYLSLIQLRELAAFSVISGLLMGKELSRVDGTSGDGYDLITKGLFADFMTTLRTRAKQ